MNAKIDFVEVLVDVLLNEVYRLRRRGDDDTGIGKTDGRDFA